VSGLDRRNICLPGIATAPVAVLAFFLACNGAARASSIDTLESVLGSYNVFLSGDMGSSGAPYTSDIEGRAAIGGSAYFANFSINGSGSSSGTALVVGNNLSFGGGTINGSAVVGGNASFPSGSTVNGTLSVKGTLGPAPTSYSASVPYTSSPVDFAGTFAALGQASSFLSNNNTEKQGTVGTVTNNFGTLDLSSSATKGIVFFNVTATQLAGINGLDFQTNSNTTAIINVSGITTLTLGNFSFQGNVDAAKTLFNFIGTSGTLNLSNLGFDGSILAPGMMISATNGQIDGTVIAKDLFGTAQINLVQFDGSLPSAPLPATWTMMLIGLAGLGLIGRRRSKRAVLSAAA
jgi:choice-of-anchor A domain-containing protein